MALNLNPALFLWRSFQIFILKNICVQGHFWKRVRLRFGSLNLNPALFLWRSFQIFAMEKPSRTAYPTPPPPSLSHPAAAAAKPIPPRRRSRQTYPTQPPRHPAEPRRLLEIVQLRFRPLNLNRALFQKSRVKVWTSKP